jgi:hypothetical protein
MGHGLPTYRSDALRFPNNRPPTATLALEKNRGRTSSVSGQIYKDRLNHTLKYIP